MQASRSATNLRASSMERYAPSKAAWPESYSTFSKPTQPLPCGVPERRVTDRGATPRLRCRDTITLLEPLADLACRLPEGQPFGMTAHLCDDSPWLFPGRQPDRGLHPTSLSRRLAALGIDARADRNTALLQLAADLPIPVLADLLGLHIGTAAK